jgi:hypothetical protein
MDLLTAQDHLDINAALGDVFDTFHKTPVLYEVAGSYANDYMEGSEDKQYTQYTLMGLVQYPAKDIMETKEGAYDDHQVVVQVATSALAAQDLLTVEDLPIFRPETDRMTINGETFIITFAGVDGPMQKRNVLTIIKGRRAPEFT